MVEAVFKLLNKKIFQNTLMDYLTFLLILIIGFVLIRIFKRIILRQVKSWSQKTQTTVDDFLIITIEKTVLPLSYFGIFYIGTLGLKLDEALQKGIYVIGVILFSFYGIRFLNRLIDYYITGFFKTKDESEIKPSLPRGIVTLIKILVWIFGIIFVLDNLGFKISTVIAGLGIGGVAVALAAQAVLKDLFSYFVILFDRPFETGDYIVLEDCMGTVERIGIKTTRIQSVGGEQLVVSNAALTDSKIRNFKRMKERAVSFSLGIDCSTPEKQLREVPGMIKNIIEMTNGAVFERAHFREFGNSSLIYDIRYLVSSSEYKRYMDIQQEINLSIIKKFAEEGINMPFPTQAVIVKRD